MLRTISNGLVNRLSNFSLDRDLMRRLYAVEKPPKDDAKNEK